VKIGFGAVSKMVAGHAALGLEMANHGLDGGTPSGLAESNR
jgi:hypothetical protein